MKKQWDILKRTIKDELICYKKLRKEAVKEKDYVEALDTNSHLNVYEFLVTCIEELEGTKYHNMYMSKEEFNNIKDKRL